jgi:hypothetical protein
MASTVGGTGGETEGEKVDGLSVANIVLLEMERQGGAGREIARQVIGDRPVEKLLVSEALNGLGASEVELNWVGSQLVQEVEIFADC